MRYNLIVATLLGMAGAGCADTHDPSANSGGTASACCGGGDSGKCAMMSGGDKMKCDMMAAGKGATTQPTSQPSADAGDAHAEHHH